MIRADIQQRYEKVAGVAGVCIIMSHLVVRKNSARILGRSGGGYSGVIMGLRFQVAYCSGRSGRSGRKYTRQTRYARLPPLALIISLPIHARVGAYLPPPPHRV